MSTSVSSAQTVLSCMRQYYFHNILGYSSPGQGGNQRIGNLGHFALRRVAAGMSYGQAIEQALQRQLEFEGPTPEEQVTLFRNLMAAHEMWNQNSPNRYCDPHISYVYTEQNFTFNHAGREFRGQWDGVIRHRLSGEYLVLERKFTSRPAETDKGVYLDLQPRLYVEAARQILGVPITGCVYEINRICDPFQVKLLKSGLPSKAKDQLESTTLEVYTQAIIQAAWAQDYDVDYTVGEYEPQLEYMRANPNPIFRRKLVPVSEGMCQSAMDALVEAARQQDRVAKLQEAAPPTGMYRFGSCQYCSFKEPCQAMDDGFDWEGMLESTFVNGKEYFDE